MLTPRSGALLPFAVVPLVALACSGDAGLAAPDSDAYAAAPSVVSAAASGKSMILQVRGTAAAVVMPLDVPSPNGETEAPCFTVELVDVRKDQVVGTATDCLSDITPVGDGVALVATTIFSFHGNHAFTTRGRTTVQPTTHGSPAITHITGAIPLPGENGVMSGTGAFSRLRASARLSGAVNLSRLDSHGEITFDCIFVIDPL